ncbi:uncharacterized protein (TIGR02453 family) [Friedmanniella endophytica]|uniref:Uncharacterized protein (TIGR02453 family) n=1 Tax=Microlunatus kandeliicorticis TaxID=1759536 RepID=A0A7W3P7C8_9ACTN|nr:DUF2461 domain-containing protein [Microlunatus kandeliicorticis]MBA8795837.1 uncharacterized protein (TIGR02453 family) [Microlunatus kandeliicorticis]
MNRTDGFGPDARRFLAELAEHNSREFFTAQRERFDRELVEPMAALIDSLPERHQPFRVVRMNRAVRFAPDKRPYKTQYAAIHSAGGAHLYLQVDAEGFLAGSGNYQFSAAQLDRYRAAVADDGPGAQLAEIIGRLRRKRSLVIGAGGESPLRTTPRGYPGDHPRIDLLRLRGLVVSAEVDGDGLGRRAALRRCAVQVFEAAAPLADWLTRHVGGADDHERGGDRGYRSRSRVVSGRSSGRGTRS